MQFIRRVAVLWPMRRVVRALERNSNIDHARQGSQRPGPCDRHPISRPSPPGTARRCERLWITTLSKARPTYLRLHGGEERPEAFCLSDDQQQVLAGLSSAFESCTGLKLEFAGPRSAPAVSAVASYPVQGVGGKQLGTLLAVAPSRAWRPADHHGATELGESIAHLLTELARTQEALWQREAELAAGVPVAPLRAAEAHLAQRLEAILRSGSEAVGCQAAALYLLNADTSLLKVRSVYGLPRERLARPPRSLGGAIADLEALLGHAIVLTEQDQMSLWSIPEPFRAACCLPVSTPTIPLGTVWFFADRERDFTTQELGILEIVAGRIATELEREALIAEASLSSRARFETDAVARMVDAQLPRLRPLSDRWAVAGGTLSQSGVLASFHDWGATGDDSLTAIVGRSLLAECQQKQPDVCDSLLAAIVRTAARAFVEAVGDSLTALRKANQLLCSLSTGEHGAELAIAHLGGDGTVRVASAGQVHLIRISPDETFRVCSRTTPPLGGDANQTYLADEYMLTPGEALLMYVSDAIDDARDAAALDADLAQCLAEHSSAGATQLALRAEELLASRDRAAGAAGGCASLVVIQRRNHHSS